MGYFWSWEKGTCAFGQRPPDCIMRVMKRQLFSGTFPPCGFAGLDGFPPISWNDLNLLSLNPTTYIKKPCQTAGFWCFLSSHHWKTLGSNVRSNSRNTHWFSDSVSSCCLVFLLIHPGSATCLSTHGVNARVRLLTRIWLWLAKPHGDLQSTATKTPRPLSVLEMLSVAIMKKQERWKEILNDQQPFYFELLYCCLLGITPVLHFCKQA